MRKTKIATSVLALILSGNLSAQPPPHAPGQDAQASAPQPSSADADQAEASNPRLARARQVLASLNYRQGDIALPEADAHFKLGKV